MGIHDRVWMFLFQFVFTFVLLDIACLRATRPGTGFQHKKVLANNERVKTTRQKVMIKHQKVMITINHKKVMKHNKLMTKRQVARSQHIQCKGRFLDVYITTFLCRTSIFAARIICQFQEARTVSSNTIVQVRCVFAGSASCRSLTPDAGMFHMHAYNTYMRKVVPPLSVIQQVHSLHSVSLLLPLRPFTLAIQSGHSHH